MIPSQTHVDCLAPSSSSWQQIHLFYNRRNESTFNQTLQLNCQKTLMDMSIQFKTFKTTIKKELSKKKDILPEIKMHWKQKKLY